MQTPLKMNTTTSTLIGKIVMGGRQIALIEEDKENGSWFAVLASVSNRHEVIHVRASTESALEKKLTKMLEPRDVRWILDRLDIINVSELARLADVPRHKIADTQRGQGKLSPQECAALIKVINEKLG